MQYKTCYSQNQETLWKQTFTALARKWMQSNKKGVHKQLTAGSACGNQITQATLIPSFSFLMGFADGRCFVLMRHLIWMCIKVFYGNNWVVWMFIYPQKGNEKVRNKRSDGGLFYAIQRPISFGLLLFKHHTIDNCIEVCFCWLLSFHELIFIFWRNWGSF